MKRGKVLIDAFDIIGKSIKSYTVISYEGKTYSHTKGGDRARHWYKCRCQKCGYERIFRRDQIVSGKLSKCRIPHKRRNKSR